MHSHILIWSSLWVLPIAHFPFGSQQNLWKVIKSGRETRTNFRSIQPNGCVCTYLAGRTNSYTNSHPNGCTNFMVAQNTGCLLEPKAQFSPQSKSKLEMMRTLNISKVVKCRSSGINAHVISNSMHGQRSGQLKSHTRPPKYQNPISNNIMYYQQLKPYNINSQNNI